MHDAADAEAVVLVGVARLAALQAAAPLDGNRPGLCGSRRKTPVGGIDHERGAARDRVVFAPMRDRRIGPFDFAGEHVDPRQIALVADPDVIEPLGVFRVAEELPRAELGRPLQRHAVFTFRRPLALQIRVAPRRAFAPGPLRGLLCAARLRRQLNGYRERHGACRQRPDHPSVHVRVPRERVYGATAVSGTSGSAYCVNFDRGVWPGVIAFATGKCLTRRALADME